MAIYIIFAVGVFVSLLVLGGLFFTVTEIKQMGKHPENYRPKAGRAFFK
ncbi:MAG: hypothetical protein ABI954_04535 [Pyrinomonadaceae bacterium]